MLTVVRNNEVVEVRRFVSSLRMDSKLLGVSIVGLHDWAAGFQQGCYARSSAAPIAHGVLVLCFANEIPAQDKREKEAKKAVVFSKARQS